MIWTETEIVSWAGIGIIITILSSAPTIPLSLEIRISVNTIPSRAGLATAPVYYSWIPYPNELLTCTPKLLTGWLASNELGLIDLLILRATSVPT